MVDLNTASEVLETTSLLSEFQTVGAVQQKARSAKWVLVVGLCSNDVSEERRTTWNLTRSDVMVRWGWWTTMNDFRLFWDSCRRWVCLCRMAIWALVSWTSFMTESCSCCPWSDRTLSPLLMHLTFLTSSCAVFLDATMAKFMKTCTSGRPTHPWTKRRWVWWCLRLSSLTVLVNWDRILKFSITYWLRTVHFVQYRRAAFVNRQHLANFEPNRIDPSATFQTISYSWLYPWN